MAEPVVAPPVDDLVSAEIAEPTASTPVRRQPAARRPINAGQLLETRVSVIREGDSVMLKLPSDVIRVVTVQKDGYVSRNTAVRAVWG